jgi:hypothetical protein
MRQASRASHTGSDVDALPIPTTALGRSPGADPRPRGETHV